MSCLSFRSLFHRPATHASSEMLALAALAACFGHQATAGNSSDRSRVSPLHQACSGVGGLGQLDAFDTRAPAQQLLRAFG